jgi:AcrR family transcriptional regulator
MPSQPFETPTASSRERLLEAAKRLFAAQGYEQTATSAIAREAGTSESQLMRYFGGKVGLLEALFEEAWTRLNSRVARAMAASEDTRTQLLAAVQTIVSTLSRDPDLATLAMFEGRRIRGDESRVRVSRGYAHFADTIRTLIRRARDSTHAGGHAERHDASLRHSPPIAGSGGQQPDQLGVRLRKRKLAQPRTGHPLHLLSQHRLGHTVDIATIEVQFDGAIRILMGHVKDALADAGDDIELLVQLASQCLDVRLVGIALAARELPVAGEMCPVRAQSQQEVVITLDDRGNDNDDVPGFHRGTLELYR